MDKLRGTAFGLLPGFVCYQGHAADLLAITPLTTRRFRWSRGCGFIEALVKAGVPAEAHIFANGPHGTGLGKGDPALDQWPNLLEIWLRAQGLLNAGQIRRRSQTIVDAVRRNFRQSRFRAFCDAAQSGQKALASGDSIARKEKTLKSAQKLRGGPPVSGVEGLPEAGCPLDPGPGLGGNSQFRLVFSKSKFFFE